MAERDEFATADLQRVWQARPPARDHLDDGTWERLFCDELTPFERDRALEHVTSCTECAAIHSGLAELRREAGAFDPGVVPLQSDEPAAAAAEALPWWRTRWFAGALSAAAVLIVAAVVMLPRGAEDYSSDVTRAGGPVVTLLQPAGNAAFERTFRWNAVDGATSYRVVVFTSDGVRSFEARDLEVPGVKVSPDVPMPPGKYFWQVTALRDGEMLAESALAPFEVSRN